MKRLRLTGALFAFLLLLFNVPLAHAAPLTPLTLTLSVLGGSTLIITDESGFGFLDVNPQAGSIVFMGAVDQFLVNMTVGSSYPQRPLPGVPGADINLQSFNVNTASAGTLTITLSNTGFGSAASGWGAVLGDTLSTTSTATGFMSNAGSLNGVDSGVHIEAWLDEANSGGAAGDQALAGDAGTGNFAFTNTLTPFVYGGTPFSIFQQAVVTFAAPIAPGDMSVNLTGITTQVTPSSVPVPEPGSLILLSTGLFLSAAAVRRRQRK